MIIKEVVDYLNVFAPLSFQEDYDNAGLNIGNAENEVSSVLVALDVTEEIVEEAVQQGANLIVAHHPVIFQGIKQINNKSYTGRIIQKAIKHDIAVFAAHTNIDAVEGGVNSRICEKLNLTDTRFLEQKRDSLRKLVVFVPVEHADKVREAMFDAGAGHIGEYDKCSYNLEGRGSFRGSEDTNPFVGMKGETHFEPEARIETVMPAHLQKKVIYEMIKAHPYEEVAYDIYPLLNEYERAGMGMIGSLSAPKEEMDFLKEVKETFNCNTIRHTGLTGSIVEKVAVCGGSGSFLLSKAMAAGADVFISADFKYHQFFEPDNRILICDIGHYESEQFTKEIFYELLTKKFTNFAVHLSKVNSNPINYL